MFKKLNIKRNLAIVLILIILLSNVSLAAEPKKTFDDLDERLDYLKLMIKYVEAKYKYDITEEELMEGAYRGIFDVLDKHSNYFSSEEFENFNVDSSGNYGGIGISVGIRNDAITVIAPIEGTPGDRAGIKAGDIIKYVDDIDVSDFNLEKAVELMRGEPGTKVRLGIIRGNNLEPIYFDIVREIIKINPVNYEMLDSNIGYIKIVQFNQNTDENVKIALEEFEKNNIKGLIIDLRDNPGGILSEVVKTADLFLPKDSVIVHIDYKNKRDTYKALKDKAVDYPLMVLVNEGSASASEIFAGSIQDNHEGIIIGTKTYGKGTVQTTIPITNGGGIKLTIAEYLTAGEEKIDGVGITPDVVVENPEAEGKEDLWNFAPMIEEVKPSFGDKGLNVYGAQQRLKYIGYDVDVTGIMEEATVEAVKKFQETQGLYPNGVLDFTTVEKLKEEAINVYNNGEKDLQLEEAVKRILK